jgi:hypothetical protein
MKKIAWYQGKNTFPLPNVPHQGYIFDVHILQIDLALQKLPSIAKTVNILLWDQGESDTEPTYLMPSLYHVINRYITSLKNLGYYNSSLFGFISVSTTGLFYLDNSTKVNDVLSTLNQDSNQYTKFVSATDLPVSILPGTTDTLDIYHFNSESQRIIGTRAFHAYRSMFESNYNK